MNKETLDLLQPIILSTAATILTVVGTWAATLLKQKVGIQVEQHHKDNLHSALLTAARSLIGKYGETQNVAELVKMMKEYAQQSVPDALNKLNPPPTVQNQLALSKIEMVRAELKALEAQEAAAKAATSSAASAATTLNQNKPGIG